MYKCEDCGSEFEEPKAERESRGEFWGFPAYETVYGCPRCGSDCYEEMEAENGSDN